MDWLKHVLDPDFTITKRLLGVGLLVAGVGALAVLFSAEWLLATPDGFGTSQKLATALGVVCVVVGVTLVPLGDQPA